MKKECNVVSGRMLTYEEIMERKLLNGLVEAVELNSRIEGDRDDEILFPDVRSLRGHGNVLELDIGNGYSAYVYLVVQRKVEG